MRQKEYRAIPIGGKDFVYGWYWYNDATDKHYIRQTNFQPAEYDYTDYAVIPESVGQYTGLCYEGDYVVMDCWNGGDGYEEPDRHDIFEGVVIYDKKICRFGLQTKICDEGHIEVGLEDSQYTELEIIGNIHQDPKLMEKTK